MSTLLVGSKYLSQGESNNIEIRQDDQILFHADRLDDLYDSNSYIVKQFAARVKAVEVGFGNVRNLAFLEHFPNTTDVWILTSLVQDISGLLHLPQLNRLAIERPSCRMDILGELANLSELYLDEWRPGAASIFNLTQLRTVRIRGYPYRDLEPMQKWTRLNHLWLAYGGLESLKGIPVAIRALELAVLRKLRTISDVDHCKAMERLIVEKCRALSSLAGIEGCVDLAVLSVFDCGTLLPDLEPVRHLSSLTYLVLTGFTGIVQADEGVLDNLQRLETLIISKKLGMPLARLQRTLPQTDIRYVR